MLNPARVRKETPSARQSLCLFARIVQSSFEGQKQNTARSRRLLQYEPQEVRLVTHVTQEATDAGCGMRDTGCWMLDARSTRRKSFEGLQAVKRDTNEVTDEVNVRVLR